MKMRRGWVPVVLGVLLLTSCAQEQEPVVATEVSVEAALPMTLGAKLLALQEASSGQIPEAAKQVMAAAEADLRERGLARSAVGVGRRSPLFELPDHTGKTIRMYEHLQNGPVVVVFYRGGWCPYCNLQLQAMEEVSATLAGLGATLLAVTPDRAAGTAETVGKHALSFPVLTEKGNRVARAFGLVFKLSPELDAIYREFGIDLAARNGSEKSELPLAATYVIGRDGVIRFAYLDEAYTRRAEPSDVVEAVRELAQARNGGE